MKQYVLTTTSWYYKEDYKPEPTMLFNSIEDANKWLSTRMELILEYESAYFIPHPHLSKRSFNHEEMYFIFVDGDVRHEYGLIPLQAFDPTKPEVPTSTVTDRHGETKYTYEKGFTVKHPIKLSK